MRSSRALVKAAKNHFFTSTFNTTPTTMPPRKQPSKKRTATPLQSSKADETPRILDEDFDTSDDEEEEEASQAVARIAQGRPATTASRILQQVMVANQKNPPSAAASIPTRAATTASPGSVSRARALQSPPVMTATPTNSTQASQGISHANHVSPPAVAHMPVAATQAMQPSLPIQEAGQRQSPPAHSVAAIPVQGDHLDDASSLSATENGNHKAMRMLHQYFVSLAASGTVRSLVEERDLITDKLGIIFSKVKFINADLDLSFEGDIAKVLYKEMKIPEAYKSIWWEQMKGHVRKKMDEKRSNCGAAIKKSIMSKCFLFIDLFVIKFSELTIFQFFHSQVY